MAEKQIKDEPLFKLKRYPYYVNTDKNVLNDPKTVKIMLENGESVIQKAILIPGIEMTDPFSERPRIPLYACEFLMHQGENEDLYMPLLSKEDFDFIVRLTKKMIEKNGDFPELRHPCRFLKKPTEYFDDETLNFFGYNQGVKEGLVKSRTLENIFDQLGMHGLKLAAAKVYDWISYPFTAKELQMILK